nr:hypothetical protein [Tanacetum cinerariifolium]
MEGWKPKSLKNKSFANIQELSDKAMKRVNTFVDYKTELVVESSKEAEAKVTEELKRCLEIIPEDGDDVPIDATPLSSKYLTIFDYKIHKEGKKIYFQILRADGNSQMYLTFSKMLKFFDREHLEVLWRLVKARFEKKKPVDYMDNMLLHNLKTMFEHHVEDNGKIVGIKRLFDDLEVTAVKVASDDLRDTLSVYYLTSTRLRINTSRRVVEKKVTITVDDNIIHEPDVALELGKSLSLNEAAKEEAARQVHATHVRIVTEPIPEPVRRRPSGIAFRDTSSVSKKMSFDPYQKLKGVQTLIPKEQIDADTRKALKQSKKTNRRQPVTEDPSEGTGISPGVPNEFTVILTTSRSKQESGYTEEEDDDETIEWVDIDEEEEKKDDNNYKSIDLEQTNNEETDDEFMHVNKDKDEEMTNDEVEEYENGDEEITYTAKVDARKTKEVKDDAKKAKLPPTSSSLLISLGFGDQFLKLLSDTSLIGTIKDTTDAEINSLLDNKIQYEVPHIQYPLILIVPVLVIYEPSLLTLIPETPLVATATTLLPHPSVSTIPPILLQTTTPIPTPPITTKAPTITTVVSKFDAFIVVQLRVVKLEKDVSELKKIDQSTKALDSLKS